MKRNTPILFVTVCVFFLYSISCDKKDTKAFTQNPTRTRRVIKPKVTTVKVTPEEVTYTIEAVGSIEADVVSIPARVSGVITNLLFKEGDYVEKGKSILAEIDPLNFKLELEKAKSQVMMARIQIKVLLARQKEVLAVYRKARIDYNKRKQLYIKNVITAEELLSFETIYAQAIAKVQEIKASIKQARVNLKQMQILYKLAYKSYKESRVVSPVSGIVQSKNVTLSQYVRPDTIIATIVDMDSLFLKFNIPQSQANRLFIGQKINFYDAYNTTNKGTAVIYYISQYANPRTRAVEIRANNIIEEGVKTASSEIDNNILYKPPATNFVRPGYFVNVTIQTATYKNAIVLPLQAVLTTENGNVVFVVEDNTARERRVETGLNTKDGRVEILEGIKENEIVVIAGASILSDGMEVEVVK